MSIADLPVAPPVAPMLAKLARQLPSGDYIYEPKWDGFRCIVFRSGQEVELGSRNELPLTRYFPEVVQALLDVLPEQAVVDGEVVVAGPAGLDFDALQQRVHPAESRVRLLAERTPASFVAFDLLALGRRDLRGEPFHERRRLLEELFAEVGEAGSVHVTPATRERKVAEDWFGRFEGAGLDGVVAKASELAYVAGKRVMMKVKHERTAEFVVGGFRWYKAASADGAEEIGSLLLGLYDADGDSGSCRRHRGVPCRTAPPIGGCACPVPRHRRASGPRRAPLGRLGHDAGDIRGPHARGAQPLERNQGPLVPTASSGTGGRGRL